MDETTRDVYIRCTGPIFCCTLVSMKQVPSPSIQILVCESVVLGSWWGRSSPNYMAPYWRLYCNDKAGLAVRFGGNTEELVPRRVYLIPPETDFSPVFRAAVRQFFVHFTAQPPFDTAVPGIYGVEDADMARSVSAVDAFSREESGGSAARLGAAVLSLVAGALARLPEGVLSLHVVDERIERVLAAMRANMKTPLTNGELADIAGMTTNAFVRRFREAVGESPQRCYTRKRIEMACVLLHLSGRSVDQIAEETGFCDRYHFSHVFRKLRGMGPSAFSRIHRASWMGRQEHR